MHAVLSLSVSVTIAVTHFVSSRLQRDEAGQSTAEYALVLLAAAAIAIAVAAWATKTNFIGGLLDTVFGGLVRRARTGG